MEYTEFIEKKLTELREMYEKRKMGRRVGFGNSPSVLVVDFINAFTDYRGESLLATNLDSQVDECLRVLEAARARKAPVIFTTGGYEKDLADAGLWPKKAPVEYLVKGTRGVEIDERLHRRPDELIVEKKYASAFSGTPLSSYLCSRRIDTLIITGCITSGCVRATAVDALQSGLHAIVVRQAVGDRDTLLHEISLSDIDSRYGDVMDVEDVLEYLEEYTKKS